MRDHQPCCGLGDDEGRPDIQPEEQVECRFVDFEERLRAVDAGVVDENVEAVEASQGVAYGVRLGYVEHQRLRPAAGRSDRAGDFFEFAGGPAHQHQIGSGGGERQRCGAADALRRAGD